MAWTVLAQTAKDTFTDSIPQWAAAVAYYGLLAVFPLLLAAIAVAGYFVDRTWATTQIISLVGRYLAAGGGFVRQTVQEAMAARGEVGGLSLLLLLWSGSRAFGVLTKALNVAYQVVTPFGFWKRLLLELALTVSVGAVFTMALIASGALSAIRSVGGLLPLHDTLFAVVSVLMPVALLFLAFALVYQYVPHTDCRWPASLAGAAFATGAFMAVRPLFSMYVQRFAAYNLVYGSLAIVIALMVWAWAVSFITLLGGEVASHVKAMVLEGRSPEETNRGHGERSSARSGPPARRPGGAPPSRRPDSC